MEADKEKQESAEGHASATDIDSVQTSVQASTPDIITSEHVSVSRNIHDHIKQLDEEVLDENSQKIYDMCSPAIRSSIGNEPFSMDKIVAIVTTITRSVQEYSQSREAQLTGSEKQAMALGVTKHVLKDLRDEGRMSEDTYRDVLIAVSVAGPVVIMLVVSAWKKAISTKQDIAANGCAGCAKRYCCVQ